MADVDTSGEWTWTERNVGGLHPWRATCDELGSDELCARDLDELRRSEATLSSQRGGDLPALAEYEGLERPAEYHWYNDRRPHWHQDKAHGCTLVQPQDHDGPDSGSLFDDPEIMGPFDAHFAG